MDDPKDILRRHWNYSDFRPGQGKAVEAVLAGRDTLVIMPTGGGKSLCYQVPALLLSGVTLVISPLISLMKDQVDTLERAGVPATFINSSLSASEMAARLKEVEAGRTKLVYVAPERFDSPAFHELVKRLEISLLAVDEAHCVSQWGHDFRPSYLRVGDVRRALGSPPMVALTATATLEVRRDIEKQLELRDPEVLVTGFDRRNLTWHVLPAKNDSEKDRLMLRLLRGSDDCSIVYASTRKSVDALTSLLGGVGIQAVGYHAGIRDVDRKRIQEAFMTGEARVVVATNAFGMGIDKPDVRRVIHHSMPGTLEAYYQEGGRAGRDGNQSDCILLHAFKDRFTHEFFIEQTYPPRAVIEGLMKELRKRSGSDGEVLSTPQELARAVSGAKGDRQIQSALRVLADYRLVRPAADGPPDALRVRMIATPKRITRDLGDGGRSDELEFLRRLWKMGGGERLYQGADIERRRLGMAAGGSGRARELLNTLQAGGFLDWSVPPESDGILVLDDSTPMPRLPIDWRSFDARKNVELKKLQKMQGYAYYEGCRRGYVLRYFGDPEAMEECGACDNCQSTSTLGIGDVGTPARARATGGSGFGTRGPRATRRERQPKAATSVTADAGSYDAGLFERLRGLRTRLAAKEKLPAYCVFSNSTLRHIAARRPRTPAEMLAVSGVGPAKMDKYGDAFLEILTDSAATH
jgi:ATP-dependent DNA helicase RecQ